MENGGNAARAGLKAGDQVIYTSSFFGDELWPADKLGFTKTAIQAKPDSVYFVVSRSINFPVSSHYCTMIVIITWTMFLDLHRLYGILFLSIYEQEISFQSSFLLSKLVSI